MDIFGWYFFATRFVDLGAWIITFKVGLYDGHGSSQHRHFSALRSGRLAVGFGPRNLKMSFWDVKHDEKCTAPDCQFVLLLEDDILKLHKESGSLAVESTTNAEIQNTLFPSFCLHLHLFLPLPFSLIVPLLVGFSVGFLLLTAPPYLFLSLSLSLSVFLLSLLSFLAPSVNPSVKFCLFCLPFHVHVSSDNLSPYISFVLLRLIYYLDDPLIVIVFLLTSCVVYVFLDVCKV